MDRKIFNKEHTNLHIVKHLVLHTTIQCYICGKVLD